ncbi:hypothetical protein SDC9_180816 [bioreactor metagenome]|uniref:Uncharacterized protein n=1 Tax=bioreactor metagenome TaxID=1076179 RepID=A0A645H2R7_9ZZZZ
MKPVEKILLGIGKTCILLLVFIMKKLLGNIIKENRNCIHSHSYKWHKFMNNHLKILIGTVSNRITRA